MTGPKQSEEDPPVAFYWGSNNGGMNNVTAAASSLEVVKTAAQMRARRVPTCEEMAEEIQGELMFRGERVDVDETEREGATVLLYGSTHDGLRVAIDVRVMGVTQVDW